jgi:glucose-6-phosphate isomerase
MKLNFYNTPQPESFNASILPNERPAFLDYQPDLANIEKLVSEYSSYQNILVIGHGGSITSFYGFYNALKNEKTKQAYFLSTVDPDYIFELKQKLSSSDTLVIAISKSGETVTQLEALNQFLDYPLLFITGKGSTLEQIAEKVNAKVVEHPVIGGRYTGFTEVGLLPLALCGVDVKPLLEGAREMYQQYQAYNHAWQAASVFNQLEQKGFVDVFVPFYSHNLFPLSSVIVQLCHESFGKEGRGQTYLAFEAPESQHHTNQRFFGGIKNMAGLFVSLHTFNHRTPNQYPESVTSVALKGQTIGSINNISLEDAMQAELHGTMEDAKHNNIPLAHLALSSMNAKEIGNFLAFWQLYAVYASLLRNVDPFNQPQVEASKKISFARRLELK